MHIYRNSVYLTVVASVVAAVPTTQISAQAVQITNAKTGLRLSVDSADSLPALKIALPGQAESDPGILVLFPEHVSAVEHGATQSRQLYIFRPGKQSPAPAWKQRNNSLEYEVDVAPGVHMQATATLENDGVRYAYRFTNRSHTAYDMIQAVTDPRMLTPYLRDVRLERTYIHRKDGFALAASEVPERLTLPLSQWLPARVRIPYTWPIDADRVAKQSDGITWYNRSERVDEPFIATKSLDGKWIVASFSYDPGNVWTNPELTCLHADPKASLMPGQTASYELKNLIVTDSLDGVLDSVRRERLQLKH
jgi:hypothetical protein